MGGNGLGKDMVRVGAMGGNRWGHGKVRGWARGVMGGVRGALEVGLHYEEVESRGRVREVVELCR